ncbi:hypothetical protein [Janthinobacterium sp. HLS12-2]|uniref:hypothetical protein n=1 Tax=Janthinobacterium sp. HLS12-2 TaxID=1259324 RepID=UPI003F1F9A92
MTKRITNDHWCGDRGEPLNPSTVRFKAKEAHAPSCEGCLFERSVGVCSSATALAVANDQPNCEDRSPGGMTYIYVLDRSDPRQLDLIKTLQMENAS